MALDDRERVRWPALRQGGAEHRDRPEEDEHGHLAEPGVAVRPAPARVEPGARHAQRADGDQPPLPRQRHERQPGQPGHGEADEGGGADGRRRGGAASRPAGAGRPGRRRCRGCRRSSRWRSSRRSRGRPRRRARAAPARRDRAAADRRARAHDDRRHGRRQRARARALDPLRRCGHGETLTRRGGIHGRPGPMSRADGGRRRAPPPRGGTGRRRSAASRPWRTRRGRLRSCAAVPTTSASAAGAAYTGPVSTTFASRDGARPQVVDRDRGVVDQAEVVPEGAVGEVDARRVGHLAAEPVLAAVVAVAEGDLGLRGALREVAPLLAASRSSSRP